MSKVLVTGANGFLGKSISKHLSSAGHTVYALTRQGLDVSDENQVSKWFLNNEVDFVIHTAIKGGRRGSVDTYGDYVTNIKMFENLFDQRSKYSLMINFGSGAEFDRSNDIECFEEDRILDAMPEDFYGLAKNMITRRIIKHNTNVCSFRLFGCFGKDEADNRLLKILKKGIENQDKVHIDSEKIMDFFYDKDVCRAVLYYMENFKTSSLPRDVNLVYKEKLTLKQISDILESELELKNSNLVLNKVQSTSYTGDWKRCAKTFPENLFIGFEKGISQIYGGA
jgi:nucleoside-diphosphate-sugar epimerase